MKRSTIILLSIIGGFALLVFWSIGAYNRLVSLSEGTESQWANVQSAYQRRADLIPNLIATVKGYADFEQETLKGVIEARSKATSVQVNADDLTPERIAAFQKAQGELKGALSRLLVTVERYPDLKANQTFWRYSRSLREPKTESTSSVIASTSRYEVSTPRSSAFQRRL